MYHGIVKELLLKYARPLGLFLAGLALIGLGVLVYRASFLETAPKIEILSDDQEKAKDKQEISNIVVEIAGEVMKPGVYELVVGSRVNDLLTAAGGLTEEADRDWVSRNLNLAQRLVDGVKIFIPAKTNLSGLAGVTAWPNLPEKINLNTASISELETLWGIGEATAQKIIAGRPYQRPEELLEKKILKSNVWEAIKDQITVF